VSQEKTEAIVLRGVDFSESSRIVTFLSPERGRLACIAKGARRKNSGVSAVLDTFNRVELVYYWKEGRQVQTLAEASLLDDFGGLKCDLERISYAAFPLELVSKIAHENEPSRDLYAALVLGLQELGAWPGGIRLHACRLGLQLIGVAGFAPELDGCVRCGSAHLAVAPGFDDAGGVLCDDCGGGRRVSAEAFTVLRDLACDDGDTFSSTSQEISRELFALLSRYAAQQLECSFRSVRVLQAMFDGPPQR
jgi:DNA repair protein RecO (recombination protein O)